MANKNYVYKPISRRMSTGAVILASFLVLIEIAVLFSKPSVVFSGHVYYISQGIAAFAILTGALFWAIAGMFTKAGRGFWTLTARFGFAFIVGALFGGIIGALSNFGRLVLIPASQGNGAAIFMLLGYVWVFAVIVYSAAWLHGINSIGKLNGRGQNVH